MLDNDRRWAVSFIDLHYKCNVEATIEIENLYDIYVKEETEIMN